MPARRIARVTETCAAALGRRSCGSVGGRSHGVVRLDACAGRVVRMHNDLVGMRWNARICSKGRLRWRRVDPVADRFAGNARVQRPGKRIACRQQRHQQQVFAHRLPLRGPPDYRAWHRHVGCRQCGSGCTFHSSPPSPGLHPSCWCMYLGVPSQRHRAAAWGWARLPRVMIPSAMR